MRLPAPPWYDEQSGTSYTFWGVPLSFLERYTQEQLNRAVQQTAGEFTPAEHERAKQETVYALERSLISKSLMLNLGEARMHSAAQATMMHPEVGRIKKKPKEPTTMTDWLDAQVREVTKKAFA